jgi:hypothetical protein
MQSVVAACAYLGVVLFFFWRCHVRLPVFDRLFQEAQPYLSIILLVFAILAAVNASRARLKV